VVEPDGTTTKLNEPGPRLSAGEADALIQAALALVEPGQWLVGSGSLPPGVADGFYAHLVVGARARGARVVVDGSGPAFALAVAAGPDLVKPNREELAEATGVPIGTLGDVVRAAQKLRAQGAQSVLASLGRDGAVLVDDHGALHGEAAVAAPRSTVGAGDAMLAGFLSAGADRRRAMTAALAWGAAAAALPGSRMPTPADVAAGAVRLHEDVRPARTLDGDLSGTP
jgi:1-phosphofructokinase